MSTTDHRIPQNMDDWMRDIEKRLTRQERRLSSPAHAIITDENFPETAPTPWSDAPTDLPPPTEAPLASPAIEVTPVALSLMVEATETIGIQDSLQFEVATDAAFTTIVLTLSARQTWVTLGPLPAEVDYWVRAVAFNAAGSAPPGPAEGPVQTTVYGAADIPDLADIIDAHNDLYDDVQTKHIITPNPVLSSNSPVAGSIAWPSFTVKYEDTELVVPAGDTSDKWVVYRWNSGTPTIQETNTKPTIGVGDMVLFSNNAGVGTRLFLTSLIDGDMLIQGTVTTEALAAEAVTADKISSNYAYLGDVLASQIRSGRMQADVTISGIFQTAETGQRSVMSNLGIFTYNPLGEPILSIPNNPTDEMPITINAEVFARFLTVLGDAEFQGNVTLGTSKTTTLAYKTSSPGSPPNATPGYDTRDGYFNNVFNVIAGWGRGIDHDYYTGVFFGASSITRRAKDATSGGTSAQVGSVATGGIHPDVGGKAGAAPYDAWGGCTEVWASGPNARKLVVLGIKQSDGTTLRGHVYDNPTRATWTTLADSDIWVDAGEGSVGVWSTTMNNALWVPRVGTCEDSTDHVIVAQIAFDSASGKWDRLQVRKVNWYTGAVSNTWTSARIAEMDTPDNRSVIGCAMTEVSTGVFRIFISNKNKVYCFSFSGTTLTRDTTREWLLGHTANIFCDNHISYGSVSGIVTDGYKSAVTQVTENESEIIDYTDVGATGSINGTTWYVANTWGKKATPTGYTYETTASPAKQFTWPKRGIVTFSVPGIPASPGDSNPPDATAYYVGSVAPSTRLNRWLQAELAAGVMQQTLKVTPTLSGVQSPSANNFPNAVAHKLLSAASDSHATKPNLITLGGDADWRLGDLEGEIDGDVLYEGFPLAQVNTFTLTVTASTTNPSVTVNYAKWARIGRLVFVAWAITFNTVGSGTYDFSTTGLPTPDTGMTHMLPLQANVATGSVNLIYGYWNVNGGAGVGSTTVIGDLNSFTNAWVPSSARVEGIYIAA